MSASLTGSGCLRSAIHFMQGKKWIAEHKHPDPAKLADTTVDLKTL